jgi:hypothetical protein
MNQFTAKYADRLHGVLSGFDRLVFRGSLRALCYVEGMMRYLSFRGVLLKDFSDFVQETTQRLKAASLAPIEALGRPIRYLDSPQANKEEIAREILREQGIREGPIGVLTSVEPCYSYEVHRNPETKRLELVNRYRKCLFLYHYTLDPTFGFMHARIQTWFPFRIQVGLNGREWLARQMDAAGLGYARHDNCFVALEDYARAQALMDAQLQTDWPAALDRIARSLNPIQEELLGGYLGSYYWSTYQSEWASDLVFREEATLRRLYPLLVRHGLTTLGSPDVMRFLGRKIGPADRISPVFQGEVVSEVKTRQEGVRIKHRVKANSVKAYDKAYAPQGSVLRLETTLNDPADFQVYRPKEGDPEGPKDWRVMRRGVADLYRRAEVSQAANDRYANALASVDDGTTLDECLNAITQPVEWHGKRIRALRPFDADDSALLEAVSRGEFAVNGLRNRDLVSLLYPSDPASEAEARHRSRRVTRQLRMLRAHGLIAKVPHTHRYQVSNHGRQVLTAWLTARQTPVNQLLPKAA